MSEDVIKKQKMVNTLKEKCNEYKVLKTKQTETENAENKSKNGKIVIPAITSSLSIANALHGYYLARNNNSD